MPSSVSSGDEVFLLVNGKVLLTKHSMDKPFETEVVQVTKPGVILGCSDYDLGMSVKPNIVSVVQST